MASGTAGFGKGCVTVLLWSNKKMAFLTFLGLQCVVPAATGPGAARASAPFPAQHNERELGTNP